MILKVVVDWRNPIPYILSTRKDMSKTEIELYGIVLNLHGMSPTKTGI